MAMLKILTGSNAGKFIDLDSEPVVVGRSHECRIRVLDEAVSRRHAQVIYEDGRFLLEDLESRNGTFLNGRKVTSRTLLAHRDQFTIADTSLEFRDDTVASQMEAVGQAVLPPPEFSSAAAHAASSFETVSEIDLSSTESSRRRRDADVRLKAVLEITRYLRSSLEPDEVLSHIVNCVTNMFPQYSRSQLFRHDVITGALLPVAAKQPQDDQTEAPTLRPVIRGLVQQVLREGKAILSVGLEGDRAADSSVLDQGNVSFMCAPLLGPSRLTTGILYIETQDYKRRFKEDDLDLFACVAILAGQALEQMTLFGARYRAVVDNAVDGIISISETGMIESVNPALVGLFGYTELELVGQDFRLLISEVDQKKFGLTLPGPMATGLLQLIGVGHEVEARRKDGTVFPIYVSIGGFEFDGRKLYTGIVHDVSERHRAEAALRRLNETLEQEVQDRTQSIRLLQDVAVIANQSESVEQAFRVVLARVFEFRSWDIARVILGRRDEPGEFADAGIWLPEDSQQIRHLVAATGEAAADIRPGAGIVGRAIADRKPSWETDLGVTVFSKPGMGTQSLGIQTALACPVLRGNEVVAVIELFSMRNQAPDPAFLETLQHVATQLGRVIERDDLQRQLVDSVWNQHRKLGQELHDTLGQSLTGIAMVADSLANRVKTLRLPEADGMAELVGMIQQAKTEVRQLTKMLYPVDVDALGLLAALDDLAHVIRDRTEIACEFRGDRTIQIRDNEVATHLFRIAQEAARNAVRHAHATRIVISLTIPNGQVTLNVQDDGLGFAAPQTNRSGGLGLRIMQYRANAMGAKLAIEPAEPTGTRVQCMLKYEEHDARSDED
jgi:PAS domain S-box-containing protein